MTRRVPSAFALIVSRNTRTAESLCSYFDERGLMATVTDRMDKIEQANPITAVVVFPDEFGMDDAPRGIRKLVRGFPRARVVVVTRDTHLYDDLVGEQNREGRDLLFVLPRPVWGWELLDQVLQPLPPSTPSAPPASEKP